MHRRRHKTCCNGHDLTAPGALYVRHDGYTDCRACKRDGVNRIRTRRALEELRTLRTRALRDAPHLVAEITERIARLQGDAGARVEDVDRDLAALVAAESLPKFMRQKVTT